MTTKLLLTAALSVASFFAGQGLALASEVQVPVNHWFDYNENNPLRFSFTRSVKIESFSFNAEGTGWNCSRTNYRTYELVVDGRSESKGTIPCTDPHFRIPFNKRGKEISMLFNGQVKVSSFSIFTKDSYDDGSYGYDYDDGYSEGSEELQNTNSEYKLSNLVEDAVRSLNHKISSFDGKGKACISALNKGAIYLGASAKGRLAKKSVFTQDKAVALIAGIKTCESYLMSLIDSSYFTQEVKDLMFVKERLQAIYDIDVRVLNK